MLACEQLVAIVRSGRVWEAREAWMAVLSPLITDGHWLLLTLKRIMTILSIAIVTDMQDAQSSGSSRYLW
jgi:hypothetical protein